MAVDVVEPAGEIITDVVGNNSLHSFGVSLVDVDSFPWIVGDGGGVVVDGGVNEDMIIANLTQDSRVQNEEQGGRCVCVCGKLQKE